MTAKLQVKWRVNGIDFSQTKGIVDKETANAAEWVSAPVTLRDDELLVTPPTINKNYTYSHESDTPEETDIEIGDPRNITGSFIKMTAAQMVDLVGGKMEGTVYMFGDTLKIHDQAMRIRFKSGGWLVFPRVQGYAVLDMNIGANGRTKIPFDFTPVSNGASGGSGIWETDSTAPVPEGRMVKTSTDAPVETKTEAKK